MSPSPTNRKLLPKSLRGARCSTTAPAAPSTSSSATNFDEYFSYNSAGLLVRWELSGQGKTGSQTFMYSC